MAKESAKMRVMGSGRNIDVPAGIGEKAAAGLLAELADAMDSKSIARKGVSVRLR